MKKTRISKLFDGLRDRGERGFIAYLTAGDPDPGATVEYVQRLIRAGVDLVELGFPFSDPVADGPVNQDSAIRALEAGTDFAKVMDLVRRVRESSEIPIVIYSYMNPLCARGFDRAMAEAAEAGVDGFLLLDLPMEEDREYRAAVKSHGLDSIMLITPTTPEERIRKIVRHGSGFVYCVSRAGVTGVQQRIESGAEGLVGSIRRHTEMPVALGFGIGSPERAAEAARYADAVVVGSALVDRFHRLGGREEGRAEVEAFAASLVGAVKAR
ncbi:tryptophan synthase subunit alpha [Kiritimatiella glycovorans]|uniref:Tryptophan synthase alpha chain n=1 Tax=Kiritimatiella glycovorans TaxID=1307763 RepID=A0A0G3EIQ2_9BACT|nr:tryptophan synthase subunit alpha [Kiritimatiella glycovorans]AKJ64705.1 Tryptophan synthase alpha chain [Kiritimatiella glycovorans]